MVIYEWKTYLNEKKKQKKNQKNSKDFCSFDLSWNAPYVYYKVE